MRRAFGRLAHAASLAIGVCLLLFLLFDSGLLGDPAAVEASQRGDAAALGHARVRHGHYARFDATALRLHAGPPPGLRLRAEANELVIEDERGRAVTRAALDDRPLRAFAAGLELPAGWRLAVEGDPELPAAGLRPPLAEGPRALAGGTGSLALGWADPVPAPLRFLHQTGKLLRFDLGVSKSQQPIAGALWSRGLRSLALALPAYFLTTALGLGLALLCASRRGRIDRVFASVSILAMAVPALLYILFLQRWFAADLQWFPTFGWRAPFLPYLVLPVLIWVLAGFGAELRFYRTVVLEEEQQRYVQAARARGLASGAALRRHVLPNVLVPLLTQALVALPFLLLGSLLLERYFGIPGLGGWTAEAVQNGDHQVLRATTFVFALLYLGCQWVADLAYGWADPRLRGRT